MTDDKFTDYEGAFGTWSGYPEGIKGNDLVEVVFTCDDKPDMGYAHEYGWNKSDIAKYRKITDVKMILRREITDNVPSRSTEVYTIALNRIRELESEVDSLEKLYDANVGYV